MAKPLLDRPAGPSVRAWCNASTSTTRAVTCEACGTSYPKLDVSENGRRLSVFLGRLIVDECCGALLDQVYDESGEQMAARFLKEFAKDPTNPRFGILVRVLDEVLRNTRTKAEATATTIERLQELQQPPEK